MSHSSDIAASIRAAVKPVTSTGAVSTPETAPTYAMPDSFSYDHLLPEPPTPPAIVRSHWGDTVTIKGVECAFIDHPDAPTPDPFFIWPAWAKQFLVVAESDIHATRKMSIWLAGIMGSGKSSIAKEYAALTGRPFFRVAFHQDSCYDDLVGSAQIEDGKTFWKQSTFVKACRTPHAVIVMEEFPAAPAPVQINVNTIVDGLGTTLPDGTTLTPDPTVNFIVAANHAGAGDETGEYVATNQCDASTVDRFDVTFHVDYLDAATEITALQTRTGVSVARATEIVQFAALTRKACERGEIATPLSMRRTLTMAKLSMLEFTAMHALQVAYLTRLRSEDRAVVEKLAASAYC